MRFPQRVLKKILTADCDFQSLEDTGEPLDQFVETLRTAQECRKSRTWLIEHAGFDPVVSPEMFFALLDIREINVVETPNRDLDIDVIRLKDQRNPDDPVSVGDLNRVLRELFRTFSQYQEVVTQDFQTLFFRKDMTADKVVRLEAWIEKMKALQWKRVGYLFNILKVRALEQEIRKECPNYANTPPFHASLIPLERELNLYQQTLALNEKWRALGLDGFRLLRNDTVSLTLQHLEKLGNGVWSLVYNSPNLAKTLELTGIRFADVTTIFENPRFL